jgi:hypothetical protein
MTVRLANDRPTGGDSNSGLPKSSRPDKKTPNDAHSIYFKVLAEHGWVGLALFSPLATRPGELVADCARSKGHESAVVAKSGKDVSGEPPPLPAAVRSCRFRRRISIGIWWRYW